MNEKLVYKGEHGRAELLLREVVQKEGLVLIDDKAIYCHDEQISNLGWCECEPCCSICIAYTEKGDNITEKQYQYKEHVYVEIKPLTNVVQFLVKVKVI